MLSLLNIMSLFSGVAFLCYGLLCLFTEHMSVEFERYGLSKFRTLVGVLEVLGGLGVLIGQFYIPLFLFATGGISLLMLLGVLTRIKVKDSYRETIPAFLLMCLNGYLFYMVYSAWPK